MTKYTPNILRTKVTQTREMKEYKRLRMNECNIKNINLDNIPDKRKIYHSDIDRSIYFKNCHHKCMMCNIALHINITQSYEIDHIIPYSVSKNNDLNNIQILCKGCHGYKTCGKKRMIQSLLIKRLFHILKI